MGYRSVFAPLVGALLVLSACGAPAGPAAGPPHALVLYVANGADGTVTRLDARDGRPLGRPLPAGPAPAQLVPGPGGRLLVSGAGPAAPLTLVEPAPLGWRARPLPFAAGDRPAAVRAIAGDGGRYAVAAYDGPAGAGAGGRPAPGPCRVALVDLEAGAVVRTHRPCARSDTVTGLALRTTEAGPVAYLAIWRPGAGSGPSTPEAGRIVALDALSGAAIASRAAGGVPLGLVLGRIPPPAPGPAERLYAVVARPPAPGPAVADVDQLFDAAGGWCLVGLDPDGLTVASERAVGAPLRRLAVAPDGRQAYAFAAADEPDLGSALVAVELATGATTRLGKRVPGRGLAGLAVTADRVYLPLPDGAEVWVGDRQGRPLGVVPVGRRPFAIAVGRRRRGRLRRQAGLVRHGGGRLRRRALARPVGGAGRGAAPGHRSGGVHRRPDVGRAAAARGGGAGGVGTGAAGADIPSAVRCPACGAGSHPAASFCAVCGAALRPSAAVARAVAETVGLRGGGSAGPSPAPPTRPTRWEYQDVRIPVALYPLEDGFLDAFDAALTAALGGYGREGWEPVSPTDWREVAAADRFVAAMRPGTLPFLPFLGERPMVTEVLVRFRRAA
jgi:hypothetical protein